MAFVKQPASPMAVGVFLAMDSLVAAAPSESTLGWLVSKAKGAIAAAVAGGAVPSKAGIATLSAWPNFRVVPQLPPRAAATASTAFWATPGNNSSRTPRTTTCPRHRSVFTFLRNLLPTSCSAPLVERPGASFRTSVSSIAQVASSKRNALRERSNRRLSPAAQRPSTRRAKRRLYPGRQRRQGLASELRLAVVLMTTSPGKQNTAQRKQPMVKWENQHGSCRRSRSLGETNLPRSFH
mmetsp:Transcript_90203/g.254491  ORF Transcript_90203/g.254491 Transcript_90203/m.254491 type:complete len:238 (-) Transcript_90203:81-794(-)